jgi:hypothetical protein
MMLVFERAKENLDKGMFRGDRGMSGGVIEGRSRGWQGKHPC